ncbi:MAG: bifunctional UDP-N-acetylglucosamine diphosphorylase/glucosamine-1-phosphate N-acetyltransferase GlmU [Desulfuromonadaceae bacterium]|nr:bifunctional UDP-N-acetylglucosamine diphosphorylase/glucosamine-1-phosphate N-acetyltransferase GlmU [Desulfuromonadaceae bacterium]
MENKNLAAVILAAGRGTRMKSDRSKVLHELCGAPMGRYPVHAARAVGADPIVMVIGHDPENVRNVFSSEKIGFVLQHDQLGTGHALLCVENVLGGFAGSLLLLCGDVPLLTPESLANLVEHHRTRQAAVTVLTVHQPDPRGYGRIIRQGEEVFRIVEEKDADEEEKRITEVNTGIYIFETPLVFDLLHSLSNDNAQGEYYLTDTVQMARDRGHRVCAVSVAERQEVIGINDRVQLAQAETVLRRRINETHMRNGVTLVDPEVTYIENGVEIGADTIIHPHVHLHGKTVIGSHCVIEPGAVIHDTRIADRVHIKASSVIERSEIGEDSQIGPMAHLRPGTVLRGHNKIGNFVETKKADIGLRSKASHLTYLGDSEIGADVNIGCGTITCNYDGVGKHKTIIEDQVFVGSDTQFVAPVHIGRNSLIGAGSTITRDVPPDALALSRAEQKNIEGWRLRERKKKTEDK